MSQNSSAKTDCEFTTERLLVESCEHYAAKMSDETAFAERIVSIVSPEVTKALPLGWQEVDTVQKARDWIRARNEDSEVLAIQYGPQSLLVGFLFLNGEYLSGSNLIDIRLGYLLAEETWGKGVGSELIKGLVDWCANAGNVSSISGGVESSNIASMRVLEKNGFTIMTTAELPDGMIFMERRFRAD